MCDVVGTSAAVLAKAGLIVGRKESGGEIDGGVPIQTDNTWFHLQGVGLEHFLRAPLTLCRGGEPFLHSVQLRATFRGDPRTVVVMWPRALCTTWSMHQRHLGEIHTGMGVICLTHVHHVSQCAQSTNGWTAAQRDRCTAENTLKHRCTSVNEMRSAHTVAHNSEIGLLAVVPLICGLL